MRTLRFYFNLHSRIDLLWVKKIECAINDPFVTAFLVMKRIRISHHLYLVILAGLLIAIFMTRSYLKQYWLIFLMFSLVAIPALAFLYAMSIIAETDLRQWRKEAATINPDQIDKNSNEGQRQWLVVLYARGDYKEAAEYAVTLSDDVLRDAPCERLADLVKHQNPDLARQLYEATIKQYIWEGTHATGSGEGLMAIDNINRVENKLNKTNR
jgi:general stress protein CsbA